MELNNRLFPFIDDSTEDPAHPKIVWPSDSDCPDCRSDRQELYGFDPQIAFVEGQLWNLTVLVDHHIKVYGGDQLVRADHDGKSKLLFL